jgi:hypothetical protein
MENNIKKRRHTEDIQKTNKMKNTINTKTLTVSLPIGFQMVLEEWIDSQTQHRDEAIYALLAHGLHAVRTIPTTSNDYEGRRSGRSSDTGMVWYVMVFYGMVWYGMVWYGMVILGGVQSTEYLNETASCTAHLAV